MPLRLWKTLLDVEITQRGISGVLRFIDDLPPSPELATWLADRALAECRGDIGPWMPALIAVGVGEAERLALIEQSQHQCRDEWALRRAFESVRSAHVEADLALPFLRRFAQDINPTVSRSAIRIWYDFSPEDASAARWARALAEMEALPSAAADLETDGRDDEDDAVLVDLRDLAHSASGIRWFERIATEFDRRSGEARRRLFAAMSNIAPQSSRTLDAARTLLRSIEGMDRVAVISHVAAFASNEGRTLLDLGLADRDEAVAREAIKMAIRYSPDSPRLRSRILELGGRRTSDVPALRFLCSRGERSPAMDAALEHLLESTDAEAFEFAVSTLTDPEFGDDPAIDDADPSRLIRSCTTRRDRLIATVRLLRGPESTPAEIVLLSPWIERRDPALAALVMRQARRSGRRAAGLLPAVIRFLDSPPEPSRSQSEVAAVTGGTGESEDEPTVEPVPLLDDIAEHEALALIDGLGPDGAAAIPALERWIGPKRAPERRFDAAPFMSVDPIDVHRVIARAAGDGFTRATIAAIDQPTTTPSELEASRRLDPTHMSTTRIDARGERLFVLNEDAALTPGRRWSEMRFFLDVDGRPAVEVAVRRFDGQAARDVTSETVSRAVVSFSATDWFSADVASGRYEIVIGDDVRSGRFVVSTTRETKEDDIDRRRVFGPRRRPISFDAMGRVTPQADDAPVSHDALVRRAHALVKGRVLERPLSRESRGHDSILFERLDVGAGVDVPPVFEVEALRAGTSASRSRRRPRFAQDSVWWLYLRPSDLGHGYRLVAPPDGVSRVDGDDVEVPWAPGPYRTGFISEKFFRATQNAIFHGLHGQSLATAAMRRRILAVLTEPLGFGSGGKDHDWSRRFYEQHMALDAFRHIGTADDVRMLEPFLKSPDAGFAAKAARALEHLDSPAMRQRLLDLLEQHAPPGAQLAMVDMLRLWNARDSSERLESLLPTLSKDPLGWIAYREARESGPMEPTSIFEHVCRLLDEWRALPSRRSADR